MLATAVTLASPFLALGQPPQRLRRIGWLSGSRAGDAAAQQLRERLHQPLGKLGWEVGKNLAIEWRYAEGDPGRLRELAEELVRMRLDLIVAALNDPIAAVQRATRLIPIVMHIAVNPVESGFVSALNQPGGNTTGTMWAGNELAGKIYQLVREGFPQVSRLAALYNPYTPGGGAWADGGRRGAELLGMSLDEFAVSRAQDVEVALGRIADARPDAVVVWGNPVTNARAREIAEFLNKRRIISFGTASVFVEAGGLFFYGPDIQAIYDRTAAFIDRILRGARPGDLPVEGPTKFELVFNSSSAAAFGFKVSKALLWRVDRTI